MTYQRTKSTLLATAAALAVGTLSGAAGAQETARLSFHWGPGHISALATQQFVDRVHEEIGDQLEIEVFPSGQLFGIREIMDALATGAVDIGGVVGIVSFPPLVPDYYVTLFPNYFDSYEQQRAFFQQTEAGQQIWQDIFDSTNTVLLAYVPNGPFVTYSAVVDMDSVEDFEGLNARSITPIERPRWEALGADVVSLPTGEVYTALQSGLVDTLNTVPTAIAAYSWNEFIEYAQLPYTAFVDAYVIANRTWYESLPEDVQAVLMEVGAEVSADATANVMAESLAALEEFQAGGGRVTVLEGEALEEFTRIDEEVVIPQLTEFVSPETLEALREFVGR